MAKTKRELEAEIKAAMHGAGGGRSMGPKHQRFSVDIQNQPRRMFDSAVEALGYGARHVYLGSSEASKMLERLKRGEPVAWSYGFESVEIAPL